MFNPHRGPRPRLTLAILRYAALDAVGMVLLAIGLAHLSRGPGIFFANFPSTTAEAVILTAAGVALMFWSGARILREIARQHMPDDERNP